MVLPTMPQLLAGSVLLGGGALAAGPILNAAQGRAREGGGSLGGAQVGEITDKKRKQNVALARDYSNLTVEQARQMAGITNRQLDLAQARAMQLAQQQGQITGGLAQQKYAYQLAGGAQSMGGQVLNTLMANANPYGAEAFKSGVNIQL